MGNTIVNVAEEAVAEELLPYKEFLHQLYLDKIIKQLLHLVFVFTPAGQSCYDEFQCKLIRLIPLQSRLILLPRRRILLQRH